MRNILEVSGLDKSFGGHHVTRMGLGRKSHGQGMLGAAAQKYSLRIDRESHRLQPSRAGFPMTRKSSPRRIVK